MSRFLEERSFQPGYIYNYYLKFERYSHHCKQPCDLCLYFLKVTNHMPIYHDIKYSLGKILITYKYNQMLYIAAFDLDEEFSNKKEWECYTLNKHLGNIQWSTDDLLIKKITKYQSLIKKKIEYKKFIDYSSIKHKFIKQIYANLIVDSFFIRYTFYYDKMNSEKKIINRYLFPQYEYFNSFTKNIERKAKKLESMYEKNKLKSIKTKNIQDERNFGDDIIYLKSFLHYLPNELMELLSLQILFTYKN